MILADILHGLFILELVQLRMLQNLKSWPPSNIFLIRVTAYFYYSHPQAFIFIIL